MLDDLEAKKLWRPRAGADGVVCAVLGWLLMLGSLGGYPSVAIVGALLWVCAYLSLCVDALTALVRKHDERTQLIDKARQRKGAAA